METTRRIHIGGLPTDIAESDVKKRFDAYGSISDVSIIRDSETNQCKGFGYITITTTDERWQKCVSVYSGSKWKGHVLKFDVAKPDYKQILKQEWEEAANFEPKPPKRKWSPMFHAKDMSLVTDRNMADRKDWKRSTNGRAVRVMKMRPPGSDIVKTIDPSKYKHNLIRLAGEPLQDRSLNDVTWEMNEAPEHKKVKVDPKEPATHSFLFVSSTPSIMDQLRQSNPDNFAPEVFSVDASNASGSVVNQEHDNMSLFGSDSEIQPVLEFEEDEDIQNISIKKTDKSTKVDEKKAVVIETDVLDDNDEKAVEKERSMAMSVLDSILASKNLNQESSGKVLDLDSEVVEMDVTIEKTEKSDDENDAVRQQKPDDEVDKKNTDGKPQKTSQESNTEQSKEILHQTEDGKSFKIASNIKNLFFGSDAKTSFSFFQNTEDLTMDKPQEPLKSKIIEKVKEKSERELFEERLQKSHTNSFFFPHFDANDDVLKRSIYVSLLNEPKFVCDMSKEELREFWYQVRVPLYAEIKNKHKSVLRKKKKTVRYTNKAF